MCVSQLIENPSYDELTIIQYAAVMGLNRDLRLTGNDFSNASTAFFLAFLIAEIPNSRLMIADRTTMGSTNAVS